MEVSVQLHASAALNPEKQLLVHIEDEARWAPALDAVKKRRILHCRESNT
jgi:hypothetical protein